MNTFYKETDVVYTKTKLADLSLCTRPVVYTVLLVEVKLAHRRVQNYVNLLKDLLLKHNANKKVSAEFQSHSGIKFITPFDFKTE